MVLLNKSNPVKATSIEPSPPSVVVLKPADPQEFHGLEYSLRTWDCVDNIDMKGSKYAGILKRMPVVAIF